MKKYTIKYREKGKEHNGVCYHYGDKTREEIIDFFGLEDDEVECYEITED